MSLSDELEAKKYHWALLIAGSQGWWNYRHQADVCHAYQVLKANGLADDHIIVMVYDDIAGDPNNPYPGKIYNKPGGNDVYPGCAKDYTGDDITPATVLAVLSGNAEAVAGVGSGRVVNSTSCDRIFVYYSDHGADGILGMPTDDFIYADALNATLNTMAQANAFKELVMYIEACESASMFQGILNPDMGVYVMTASNSVESSWATYCPDPEALAAVTAAGQMPGAEPTALGTCMGDLFSVAWIEDTEDESISDETLGSQYRAVRARTSNNGTFTFGSHVMRFGEQKLDEYPVGDFMGPYALPPKVEAEGAEVAHRSEAGGDGWIHAPQRDGLLVHLMHRVAKAEANGENGGRELDDLRSALEARHRVDRSVEATVRFLVATGAVGEGADPTGEALVSMIVNDRIGDPAGALLEDWDCLRALVAAWRERCGRLDDYGMKHTRAFANLCNAGVGIEEFRAAAGQSDCQAAAQPMPADVILTT
ncbi:unnamed protein product [Ostreobium quekettii]|uniref:legumain n=1 Tax=Ostreobium quekettii TaxID=121088 RepID=A0A8S1IZD8_9CHLO|nr:unnamed protein product [Ostreobium quekettii]